MNGQQRLLERAFEIAQSGGCRRVEHLRLQLRKEGYSMNDIDGHTRGRSISKQLTELIASRSPINGGGTAAAA